MMLGAMAHKGNAEELRQYGAHLGGTIWANGLTDQG